MSLTVHHLQTRCRSPRSVEHPAGLVQDVAGGLLASELGAQLGPSLDRLPAVVRLKRLHVGLRIPARSLTAARLASAWARAFSIAIHRALAHPPGDGVVSSRRYDTPAAYEAAMLYHAATQGLTPCWEFPEIRLLRGRSSVEASLEILLSEGAAGASEILAELSSRNQLDFLLAFWDEISLERIIRALSEGHDTTAGLDLDGLIELGRAAAADGGLHPRWPVASRRQAIRLWVRARRRWALRATWHGLRLLVRMLEIPALPAFGSRELLEDPIPFPSWCADIVASLADELELASGREPAARRARLAALLETLRPRVATAAVPLPGNRTAVRPAWIHSECAGILLMLFVVHRLGLTRFARKPEFLRFGGMRAFSFLLAGIGMSLLQRGKPPDAIEAAVAVFAGMVHEPDVAGMRQFFAATDVSVLSGFAPSATWPEALDRAATQFTEVFAACIRGFRKASRESVVKQFIRVPGRILVEEARIMVVLDPNPYAVALHLSGVDDPLAGVEWLGGRRVEFVLEGL